MNNDLNTQAKELAARRYSLLVFREMTTEEEPIYVALNPELDGCFAQGETSQEARENLDAFRVDFILHLLTHGLPVPEPIWNKTETEKPEPPGQLFTTISRESTRQQEDDLSTSVRVSEIEVA